MFKLIHSILSALEAEFPTTKTSHSITLNKETGKLILGVWHNGDCWPVNCGPEDLDFVAAILSPDEGAVEERVKAIVGEISDLIKNHAVVPVVPEVPANG